MHNNKDVYIIGGGLGGLVTGALLGKNGYRVTVLEKNAMAGGGLQTFRRYGVEFETGMHILGGLRRGGAIRRLLSYLGIFDELNLHDVDATCMDQVSYLADGKTFRIPEGKENFIGYFQSEFPAEARGIRGYVDKLFQLVDEIDFYFLRTDDTHVYSHDPMFYWAADELLNHYIADPRLRDVLSYMNPMYGGMQGRTPAYISALINVIYISGATRFTGNSGQLTDALTRLIVSHGGQVVTRAEVTGITVDGKMVTDIEVNHRQLSSLLPGTMTVGNAQVVCSLHPQRLLTLTDTKLLTKAYRSRIMQAPNSYSTFCVYIIFKPDSFPYINHTCYLQKDYGKVWQHQHYDADTWPHGLMYMTPRESQQGPFATKMIINSPMPFYPCRPWEETVTGHRGPGYEHWKHQHTERILQLLEQQYPGFRACCQHIFAGSPLTIRDYYGEPEGALYGLHKDCINVAESQVPVFTKLHNLFMTGQNVNLHGFCGVPLTAITTAEAVMGEPHAIVNQINAYEQEN